MTTEQASVPKTLRKIKENAYGNISYRMMFIFVGWSFASLFLMYPLLTMRVQTMTKTIIYALLLAWWMIFILFFRSSEMVDFNITIAKYLLRSDKEIAKYTSSTSFLKTIIPVERVHQNGLIEFTNKHYGVLLRIDPPRIDDDIDIYLSQMKKVVNGLQAGMVLKTIARSTKKTTNVPGEILNAANKKENTRQREYLYNMYSDTVYSDDIVEWEFIIFIDIGKYESADRAEIVRQSTIPGILNSLRRAGVLCVPVTDAKDIAMTYRSMISQKTAY